ncbi:type II toxin-antitoxin system VapC family toxin [Pseudaminobacter soli (ex Li et al. 2025)]|uniref:Ribonuclease VapC n=1 Tax=Pseudaminobacter soli (ex Li et al. 2025) TaxID=1295366 RepID=A0A2P7S5X5_9HYPH|nr:type II toxin-antitoxin system VapC family toxin [Mesorhizobium soli]PSJ57856.1 VapC toxin family PIN domain ribonuclease [Mesorhizobium soli]
MIVLDTNVVSEASKPSPSPAVLGWFQNQNLLELYLCGPVVMEQTYGAERYRLRTGSDRFIRVLDQLVHTQFRNRILEFDGGAPSIAGKLRAMRERRSRPVSLPDAMIAAICLVNDATLATRNVRDFDGLDLKLVNPFEAG